MGPAAGNYTINFSSRVANVASVRSTGRGYLSLPLLRRPPPGNQCQLRAGKELRAVLRLQRVTGSHGPISDFRRPAKRAFDPDIASRPRWVTGFVSTFARVGAHAIRECTH